MGFDERIATMTQAAHRTAGAPARLEARRGGLGTLPLLFAPLAGALLLALVFGQLLEPAASATDHRPVAPVAMPASLQTAGPIAR